jgi:release factor glutamine methyltransferase
LRLGGELLIVWLMRPPGVYRPQADTGLLVEALTLAAPPPGARVLDVGCGTGVLSVTAALRGAAEVVAFDLSRRAVFAARFNAWVRGLPVRVHRGDALDGALDAGSRVRRGDTVDAGSRVRRGDTVDAGSRVRRGDTVDAGARVRRRGTVDAGSRVRHGDTVDAADDWARFDLVLANPPYVPGPGVVAAQGRARAWDAGPDGRAVLDRLCALAPLLLAPGGLLLMVHSALCDAELTLHQLRGGGLKASVVARREEPFGPVMRGRAQWLVERGLIAPGQRHEELVVIRADRPDPG